MFMVRKRTGDSKFNDLRGDVKVGAWVCEQKSMTSR
jgi:hypothetical protein